VSAWFNQKRPGEGNRLSMGKYGTEVNFPIWTIPKIVFNDLFGV